VKPTFSL